MRINNNLSALTAFNSLTRVNNQIDKTIQQLSTGLRINSAADDAAGLAISEHLRAQSAGLDRALKNSQDGISLIQTAEGALGETNSMLQRMRELAVQAANDTLTSQDRSYIQLEIDQLKDQIDRIANTTEFNGRSILDGSVCGTITTTDPAVKGYVRGALETEGNFRIEVKTNPGEAQVQKSSIMRVKHENVVTNKNLNSDSGVGGVKIDNMPAGNYSVTATKIGGGETIATYAATIQVESPNNSGVEVDNERLNGIHERVLLRVTGETEGGKTVYWPDPNSYGAEHSSYYDSSGRYGYLGIDIPGTATSKADISRLIADKINATGGNITMYSDRNKSDPTVFEFSAEVDDDGNCVITSVSKDGRMSKIEFKTIPATTITATQMTKQGQTSESYSAVIQQEISVAEGTSATSLASERITVTVQSGTDTHPVNISLASLSALGASATREDIAKEIASQINSQFKAASASCPSLNGKTITLDSEPVPGSPTYCRLIAKAVDADGKSSNDISISIASSSEAITLPGLSPSSINKIYTTEYKGKITGGNKSDNTERIRIGANGRTINKGIEVNIPKGTTDKKEISRLICEAVKADSQFALPGSIQCKYSDTDSSLEEGEFTIKGIGTSEELSFSVQFLKPDGKATTQISDCDFEKKGSKETPGSVASLTGFYGDSSTAQTLSDNITTYVDCTKAENNASILFSVTGIHTDEVTGKRTVTFSAASNVLRASGENKTYTDSISLSDDFNKAEIGSLLGEDDSHLTLSLPDLDRFGPGDKFVLSVSGSGNTSNAADTSLYINGTQDSSWPYSWSGDYVTYNNNDLYYNVNAQSVSNRDINIRNFYLDSDSGKVHEGNITLTLNSDFGEKAQSFPDAPTEGKTRDETGQANIAQFTANYVGKVAEGDTKLRDLEQFWDNSGVFMLQQPQVITISQNDGKKAQITLNAADTLNDVRQKLNDAIAFGLGHGTYVQGGNADKIVTFVEDPDNGAGLETVKGTFMIRSLIPGKTGELTFSSENGKLIDALGLNTVIDAQEGGYIVSVFNAHDNSVIARNVKTSGNVLQGVIDKNVDIEFSAMSGVNAVWSDAAKNFVFTPETESYSAMVHLVKNNITFQTGANEGQEITIDIGNMSASSLGISGVNVMTHKRASEAITTLDAAMRRVSSQRSTLGTYQNSLEHTLENLITENEGMISADSRIRDTDMSKAMLDLVKFRIINQSSTSMLAQANQLPRSILNIIQQ